LTPWPAKAWKAGERSRAEPFDATTYTIEYCEKSKSRFAAATASAM
jgi:hypothetical protein